MIQNIQKPRLLDQVRAKIRAKAYSLKTEKAYVYWIRQYILFHNKRHPLEMGAYDIEVFLSHLAMEKHVAASTQNQALSALLFLYREVLNLRLYDRIVPLWAKKRKRIPVVLTVEETKRLFAVMVGMPRLVAELLYGSGMRLQEGLKLRVQDLDFETHQIRVLDAKGAQDRLVNMPKVLKLRLQQQLEEVQRIHKQDRARGYGHVVLPGAYHRKNLAASADIRWQFVFPATRIFHDEKTGNEGRWHVHASVIQKAVRGAAIKAGIMKRATPHVLRHSFAMHMLASGCDVRTLQSLLGHKSLDTTMVYMHILGHMRLATESPLDYYEFECV